ncbi:hypothetical protein [Spirosoma sordidisoli]|uniref:Uncharacterized protein n=1 Tax=Spirosoma sordidisoli TaxID=2502893 RepID=A0A4Q2UQR6_9BACT|nr:hypothetical protein [Spirosoma sordidisoli]RYC70015.1 hypothetical protein EQG79_09090 [Spirosoma sordidisoli]
MNLLFEKREVTRPASPEEKGDLMKRLLEVLSQIDQTEEEKKSVVADYNSQLKDMNKRVIQLRYNLQTNTVTQEVDVHAVINEMSGMTEYYDRNGIEVIELRHKTSRKDQDEAAAKRQLAMFDEQAANPDEDVRPFTDIRTALDIADLGEAFGQTMSVSADAARNDADPLQTQAATAADIRNAQPLPETGFDVSDTGTDWPDTLASVDETDTAAEPTATTGEAGVESFDPAGLDLLQADANVSGALPDRQTAPKPVRKSQKKPKPVTA